MRDNLHENYYYIIKYLFILYNINIIILLNIFIRKFSCRATFFVLARKLHYCCAGFNLLPVRMHAVSLNPIISLPSRTQISTTALYYTFAVGKICDNPILNKSTSIFSENYNTSQFYSYGWCASGSTPYLMLDLGKEYHITRVVTMGDKDQTKWSESYTLKYSHKKSLADQNNVEVYVYNDLLGC